MQVGCATHRTNLSIAEEPTHRQGSNPFTEHVGVMAFAAVQKISSTAALENQCCGGMPATNVTQVACKGAA
jgi:hypothetical protein